MWPAASDPERAANTRASEKAHAHPAARCPVRSATGAHHGEELVVLTGGKGHRFPAGHAPVLSINRGFSARW
jgi:hypothetical protein